YYPQKHPDIFEYRPDAAAVSRILETLELKISLERLCLSRKASTLYFAIVWAHARKSVPI
ncbi:MAG TPA: hypothetical protein PLX18_10830, partial [Anaerohalosphaeraceae bacterium]|nr:hypothetical protein [Anaerohalosphaeraceae bacterium]HQJ68664.1 hypothetical protein [Anaerohalosphaeraceae bacterium]